MAPTPYSYATLEYTDEFKLQLLTCYYNNYATSNLHSIFIYLHIADILQTTEFPPQDQTSGTTVRNLHRRFSIYSWLPATVELFLSFPNHLKSIKRLYSRQKSKFKLGIVNFQEFQVVFTVSSFVGNPVRPLLIVRLNKFMILFYFDLLIYLNLSQVS